jgi:hypothetical protein
LLEPGNVVVICSDGLHGLVSEEEIYSYVKRLRPANAVDALVRLANDRGGPDNISVVVVRVLGSEADEADTERGFATLEDKYVPVSGIDLSEIAPTVRDSQASTPTGDTATLRPNSDAVVPSTVDPASKSEVLQVSRDKQVEEQISGQERSSEQRLRTIARWFRRLRRFLPEQR